MSALSRAAALTCSQRAAKGFSLTPGERRAYPIYPHRRSPRAACAHLYGTSDKRGLLRSEAMPAKAGVHHGGLTTKRLILDHDDVRSWLDTVIVPFRRR